MALGTGDWFPRGPGHDVEAGHEDDVARGLEADDALLLAFVLDGSSRSFLRYFSRRGGEGVVQLVKSSLAVRVKIELELSARSSKSTGALRPLSK